MFISLGVGLTLNALDLQGMNLRNEFKVVKVDR